MRSLIKVLLVLSALQVCALSVFAGEGDSAPSTGENSVGTCPDKPENKDKNLADGNGNTTPDGNGANGGK